jgi:transposase-like protein
MERRKFTREFKLEAVRLIRERGVSYTQASADLGVHQSQLRGWVKSLGEPLGQCLGQCGDGELLLVAEDRTNSAQIVPNQRRGKS